MYYLFIMRQVICRFVYIGKNPRFTAFLNSNLHTRLSIVTENELGLAFPPRNLPKKISSRSVHVLFSYRGNKQTNRQTDRQTNAGENIIPRFRGDNYPTSGPLITWMGDRLRARIPSRCETSQLSLASLRGR